MIRQTVMTLLDAIRRKIRAFRFGVWTLSGTERDSGDALHVVYAGDETNKNYIANLFSPDGLTESYLGKKWLWDLWRLQRQPDPRAPLFITELRKELRSWCGLQGLYAPVWVEGAIWFEDIARQMKASEHVKSDLRRIRKNGLGYEVTRGTEAITDFYHRMYRPHTWRAHGNEAVPHSLETMLSKAPRSDLLLITRDGQILAGEMIVYEPEGPHFWCSGVVDGNQDYVKAGALAALYYYRYVYLSEKGYDKVYVGASRAFLRDGVFQYKKKWGMRVVGGRDSGFLVSAPRSGNGERAFLKNNPFIYDTGAELRAAMFVDTLAPADMEQLPELYRRHCVPGLAGLDIHCFNGLPLQLNLPEELRGRITIAPAR